MPIPGLDPCGAVMDPIRTECVSTVRPYYDRPEVEVPVRWYRAPKDAKEIPRTIFGNPIYSEHHFRPVLGLTRKFTESHVGNVTSTTGQDPCGTVSAFTQGVSFNNPAAPCNCEACVCLSAQEVPTGDVDNVNKVFTLSQNPVNAAGVQFFVDGVIQIQGVDYTISGKVITTSSASRPRVGNTVYAVYVVEMT